MKNNIIVDKCVKVFVITLISTTILLFFGNCKNEIIISEVSARELCELAVNAQENKDFEKLIVEIEQLFQVNRQSIYIRKDGIYIIIKKFVATEDGYYICMSNNILPEIGFDPSFKKIYGCLFKYHISG